MWNFLCFLDEDAKLMSSILNLKLANLNSIVLKCGFPINSLDKYIKLINQTNYSVKIIDSINNISYNLNEYVINSKIKDLLSEISKVDTNVLSISEAYNFIDKLKAFTEEILKEI